MFKNFRIFLWGLAVELEYWLYPYDSNPEEDYYIKIKNDETGEKYFVMDWIKSHNDKIERLQDEMIWVKDQIRQLQQIQKEENDRI